MASSQMVRYIYQRLEFLNCEIPLNKQRPFLIHVAKRILKTPFLNREVACCKPTITESVTRVDDLKFNELKYFNSQVFITSQL